MPKNITSVNWTATNLPTGLSIGQSTGKISGTPNVQPGDYTASVTVTTNYGSDTENIKIKVGTPSDWLPNIDADQVVNCTAGEAMTAYTVTGQNVTLS